MLPLASAPSLGLAAKDSFCAASHRLTQLPLLLNSTGTRAHIRVAPAVPGFPGVLDFRSRLVTQKATQPFPPLRPSSPHILTVPGVFELNDHIRAAPASRHFPSAGPCFLDSLYPSLSGIVSFVYFCLFIVSS